MGGVPLTLTSRGPSLNDSSSSYDCDDKLLFPPGPAFLTPPTITSCHAYQRYHLCRAISSLCHSPNGSCLEGLTSTVLSGFYPNQITAFILGKRSVLNWMYSKTTALPKKHVYLRLLVLVSFPGFPRTSLLVSLTRTGKAWE